MGLGGYVLHEKVCLECKKEFTAKRKDKVYCSQACNFKAWDKRNPRQRRDPK